MQTSKRAYDRKVSVRMDKALYNKATAVAESLQKNLSEYIRYLLLRGVFIDDAKANPMGE